MEVPKNTMRREGKGKKKKKKAQETGREAKMLQNTRFCIIIEGYRTQ
jgi:hypothetical protein